LCAKRVKRNLVFLGARTTQKSRIAEGRQRQSQAARLEELDALLQIFPDELALLIPPCAPPAAGGAALQLTRGTAACTIMLPAGYPLTPPALEVEGLRRGGASAVAASWADLAGTRAGAEPYLFQLITSLRELLAAHGCDVEVGLVGGGGGGSGGVPPPPPPPLRAYAGPAVARGPLLVERKSGFQAHAAVVRSREEVDAALGEVLRDPRVARATHNVVAWRMRLPGGALAADNEDDGEEKMGARLAQLLEDMGADNVLLVVSRWFGGVLLGPSRFGVFANVGRSFLEAQPWWAGRASKC
jgi:hypothetical protein